MISKLKWGVVIAAVVVFVVLPFGVFWIAEIVVPFSKSSQKKEARQRKDQDPHFAAGLALMQKKNYSTAIGEFNAVEPSSDKYAKAQKKVKEAQQILEKIREERERLDQIKGTFKIIAENKNNPSRTELWATIKPGFSTENLKLFAQYIHNTYDQKPESQYISIEIWEQENACQRARHLNGCQGVDDSKWKSCDDEYSKLAKKYRRMFYEKTIGTRLRPRVLIFVPNSNQTIES